MTAESRLFADLHRQAEQCQVLATEARQRSDQRRRGDLDLAYLYGCADQFERNASAIRKLIGLPVLGGLHHDYHWTT